MRGPGRTLRPSHKECVRCRPWSTANEVRPSGIPSFYSSKFDNFICCLYAWEDLYYEYGAASPFLEIGRCGCLGGDAKWLITAGAYLIEIKSKNEGIPEG